MKRKFVINIIFLVAINLLVKTFWVLGIDRSVQNIAGEEEYGFYFSLFSFSVLFTLLLDLGIAGFNNRAVSSDPSKLRAYFGNILVIRLSASAVYFIITILAAFLMNYSDRQLSLLLVLMLNQIFASVTIWLRSNISGLQHFFLDSILSVADRLVMIFLCSLILWGGIGGPFRIESFVYAQTVAYVTVMITAFLLVIRMGHIKRLNFSFMAMKGIVRAGIPYALVALFMTLYWRMDSVMLERILPGGRMQAGAYAQSFRLFDAFAMIPVMFGGLLLPVFSRELSGGKDLRPIVSIASKMLLTPISMAAVMLVTWPEEILDLLYTSSVTDSVSAFRLLMTALIPVSLIYIYSTILTAAGKMSLLAVITAAAMLLNLILNLILIPDMTITGSAIAALTTQSLVALLCIITVRKTMFNPGLGKKVLLFIGMILVTLMAGLLCRMLQLSWTTGMAIQGAVGLTWVLMFRMIEPMKAIRLIAEKP